MLNCSVETQSIFLCDCFYLSYLERELNFQCPQAVKAPKHLFQTIFNILLEMFRFS